MVEFPQNPILFAVLSDRDWAVQAEWPDGTIEQVLTFKSHSAARSWIANQAQAWLRDRQSKVDNSALQTL